MSQLEDSIHLKGLTEREAVIDAVLRFVNGFDDADPDLLRSAFTQDATCSVQPTSKIDRAFEKVQGVDEIVDLFMSLAGKRLETLHCVSNFRVSIEGDRAKLTANELSQHYRVGQAIPADSNWLLMGNRHKAYLRKEEDGLWKMETFILDYRWIDGDWGVLGQ